MTNGDFLVRCCIKLSFNFFVLSSVGVVTIEFERIERGIGGSGGFILIDSARKF